MAFAYIHRAKNRHSACKLDHHCLNGNPLMIAARQLANTPCCSKSSPSAMISWLVYNYQRTAKRWLKSCRQLVASLRKYLHSEYFKALLLHVVLRFSDYNLDFDISSCRGGCKVCGRLDVTFTDEICEVAETRTSYITDELNWSSQKSCNIDFFNALISPKRRHLDT